MACWKVVVLGLERREDDPEQDQGRFCPSVLVMNFTNKLLLLRPAAATSKNRSGAMVLESCRPLTATLTSPGPLLGLGLAHGYCNMGSTVTCHGRYADDMI